MFFKLISYLNFIYHSKNEHGVHSPFVFNLVTKCLYDKTKKSSYDVIRLKRNALLKNKNATIEDTILPLKDAKALFRIVNYFQPTSILSLDAPLSLANTILNSNCNSIKVTFLENILTDAQPSFTEKRSSQSDNEIDFQNLNDLKSDLLQHKLFDFIYIDLKQIQNDIVRYFELLLPTAHNNSVWIFANSNQNTETAAAWKIIKNHPKITVTVATFTLNFVFFRTEQQKEHFVIRL